MHKNPFFVVEDFLSPLQCENIVKSLKHNLPNVDQVGNPTVTLKGNRLAEIRIMPFFESIQDDIETHYDMKIKTLTPFVFEWYPTGFPGSKAACEGSKYIVKKGQPSKWQKVKDYDFTGIIMLNDFNDGQDFDLDYEVRGGKLEFTTHGFGFNQQRGTLIIFPTRPNFINAVAPVDLGDSTMIRFQIICQEEFIYDPENFQGDYLSWFG